VKQGKFRKEYMKKEINSQRSYWVEDGVPAGNGQIGEGTISVKATENVTLKTTRHGINAVAHKIRRFANNIAKEAKNAIEDVKNILNDNQER